MPLYSEAEIPLPDPAGMAATLAAYLAEHDVPCETQDGRMVVDLGVGTGAFEATAAVLKVRVEAADLGALQTLRSVVASNLVDFVEGSSPVIVWRGHASSGATFANFREVTLKSSVDIAPRMRRLTFTGDVGLFASATDIHVRLYFPPASHAAPEWPRPGEDGRTIWPAEENRPEVRYYTVRRVDPDVREIDIDFVLHDDAGPGCAFAASAKPGAICGMAGPLGRMATPAAFTVLAGDETAMPAIARILESMDRGAAGEATIEVDGPADEIPLDPPRGVAVRWLHRRGAPAGTTEGLVDAVRAADLDGRDDIFVWVACEFAASKAIRRHLKTERRLPRETYLVVGYWAREAEPAG